MANVAGGSPPAMPPYPSNPPAGQAPSGPPSGPPRGPSEPPREGRSGSRGGITPTGWLLRGLGLCAVSVVSGLLWLVIKPDASSNGVSENRDQASKGVYAFEQYSREEGPHCQEFSTDEIAEYFSEHPCGHLTRALYTTALPNGERVLTSVVTALMPNEASAAQLEKLTTRNGTGNIEDLVSAGRPMPDDFPELDGDRGYASQQQGRLVVIGESAYFANPDHDDARLKKVTTDALRLGWPQDKAPE
ncbi:hypothetical protein DFQ14_11427 [Halopolyspora algeriensis]|uniref:Uncharacterized protein n=1 Tax=Halopolyspora algeriensis TaxID=1500506 RepID=A0A368VF55_9ACTN|nr:hypothetical protein [Halopolyspora algeriensis]RCW39766.1 hypothetical protein DFQ14_11427 [Halopolyspora algeriensis]TQM56421.1 hypothetical protein FHU43_1219 [Halopolyspora algeriensis]